jgi:tetratricopeptide (TPR) repeat protein
MAVDAVQLAGWAASRTYDLEEAKASATEILGPDAVLLGAFAPALVQDGRRVGIAQFGTAAEGVAARQGATHVVFGSAEDAAAFARAEPERAARVVRVTQWPFRARHLRLLQLYRLADTGYAPTAFERAVAAMDARQPEAALALLSEHAGAHGETADALSLEARALAAIGDVAGARSRLERALEARPTNAFDWFNLGSILAAQGDRDGALRAVRRARDLDPWNVDVRAAVARLEQGGR